VSEIVTQLAEAAAKRDFGAVETLWFELLDAETVPADDLARVLANLAASGNGPRALDLVMALAPELVKNERYAEALPLLRAVAPAAKGNEELRSLLVTCYRRTLREVPHAAACLERSGILTHDDIAAAVEKLERFLSYREGDYFYHASGWGVGRIAGFAPLTARVTLDFESKPGHQVPIETLETIFTRLQPDNFLVLRKTDPDRLRTLAKDDPARLVRMAVQALGGRLSLKALRELLEGSIVPDGAWAKWWSRARTAIKRDPHIAMTAGTRPVLTLRAEALTYEDEMQRRFAGLKDLVHLTQTLAEYADHRDKNTDPEAFLLPAARTVAQRIATDPHPGAAFEASLLLTRLRLLPGEFPTPEEIIARHKADPIPLLNELTSNANRARAFALLREQADDRRALCARILLEGPESLWEAAAARLPQQGDPPSIEALVRDVFANPRQNLELFAWMSRNLLLGRWKSHTAPIEVFEKLLQEGDALARRKTYQRGDATPFEQDKAMSDIRGALRAGDLRYFDELLQGSSEAEAARLLFRIRQSSLLPEQFARTLEQKIVRKFPKLLVEHEHREAPPGGEYIYATPEAIARRRKEHDHIVNVLIPKNSADIAKAKETGDVTDNADFRAAIQEQHVLNAKAIEMGMELQRARPIEPSMISRDHVSIGARVTVESTTTGERKTFDILGPWDSDAERGIIAYMAPLAQALMRHKVGDEVTFSHAGENTTYRIVSLGSALEPRDEAES